MEAQVKRMQKETTPIQTLEQLAREVSHMFFYENDEMKRMRVILLKNIDQLESLHISSKQQAEMIDEVDKRKSELSIEVVELKNKNINKSTLRAT